MSDVLDSAWFYWAVGVGVGFPLCLVLLTELHNALRRRGSYLARPVHLLRSYILPLGALLVLLVQAVQVSGEATAVRIVATVFGFVVLVLLLSAMNATLFHGAAPEDTWRRRIPSIFLDVARFALIAVGVALILAYIWGANVGGLFTALGISSIVLGLALQNAVGGIISGLLVIFEQPFRLGDWVDTPSVWGRVVEVNWRATHIDTDTGLQVIPNSKLATTSFTNLSRPPGAHTIMVPTTFAVLDAPDQVCATLDRVARNLSYLRADAAPSTVTEGDAKYVTSIPLRSPADGRAARSMFLRWAWYAARRAGLHLDDAAADLTIPERVAASLRSIAPALRLSDAEQRELLPHARIARYGTDEPMQFAGEIPVRMTFVVRGRVRLVGSGADGSIIEVRTAEAGDFLGQTTLTREPVATTAYALTEVTVVEFERAHLEELVAHNPRLLQEFGRAIEERQEVVRRALVDAD